jgi:hypothetical protein
VLADLGLREKDAPPSNIKCCERGTWNERFTRVKEHLEARLWYLAALINCLLRLTQHKRSLAEFAI